MLLDLAIEQGIEAGIASGVVKGWFGKTGRLTPAAQRYLDGGDYSAESYRDRGIRRALVELGFLRPRWGGLLGYRRAR